MLVFRQLSDFTLDDHDPVPKYEQLKRILLAYISGLPPHLEYLPYEEEIGRQFAISRRTVRKALEELRQHGVIETSKKRGSRVLKRQFTPEDAGGSPPHQVKGSTIGLITISDRDEPDRTGNFRWQVVAELERLLMPQECNLVVYNLRENHWQTWQNHNTLIDSMRSKGIKWALVYALGEAIVKDNLFGKLLQAGIKPVAMIQDFASMNGLATRLAPGVDYVVINHSSSLVKTLEERFGDADFIAYVTNRANSYWSGVRAEACREFADARNIPFEYLISPSQENVRTVEIAAATVQELLRGCAGRARPLCLAANDMIAESVVKQLHAREEAPPQQLRLVGYDNEIGQRALNLSTFDFDPMALAQAALELYRDFLRDRDFSLRTSRGIMTYTKFISRMTP